VICDERVGEIKLMREREDREKKVQKKMLTKQEQQNKQTSKAENIKKKIKSKLFFQF
jgi:hypothetical protein